MPFYLLPPQQMTNNEAIEKLDENLQYFWQRTTITEEWYISWWYKNWEDLVKKINEIIDVITSLRTASPSWDIDAIVETIKIQERWDTNPRWTTINEVKLRWILERHLKPSEEEPTTMTEAMIKAEEKIRKFRHDILYNKWITEIWWKLYEFKEVAKPSEDKWEEICKHKSDWMVYTSMPPKRRCKKCWKFYR